MESKKINTVVIVDAFKEESLGYRNANNLNRIIPIKIDKDAKQKMLFAFFIMKAQRPGAEPPGRLCARRFSIHQHVNEDLRRLDPGPKARSVPAPGWAN
jgi:hypothetical protein